MPTYAKIRSSALVLPSSYPAANPLGSVFIDGTSLNALTFRDYAGADAPIISGSFTSTEIFTKRKKNLTGSPIPTNTMVALKADGSICLAESDVPANANAYGTSQEIIADGDYGSVLTIGPNSPSILDGLGFTTGDIIYLGDTPGSLTNDLGSIIGEVKVVGIADCPTDTQSSVATDLIITNGNGSGGGGGANGVSIEASTSLSRGYPISLNSSGLATLIDITNEASSYAFCGVTSVDCLIGGTANVLGAGSTLFDIPASFGMTGQWGKPVFVSHAGSLTLVKPVVGFGGYLSQDFILRVGVTTKNPTTGTTDLILNPTVVGQLA
jgi:hypothetical protein